MAAKNMTQKGFNSIKSAEAEQLATPDQIVKLAASPMLAALKAISSRLGPAISNGSKALTATRQSLAGAAKTIPTLPTRTAGVAPGAFMANPIKNTYRAATLAGAPNYARAAKYTGLGATGVGATAAAVDINNKYQTNIVKPYDTATAPLLASGMITPEQKQQGLAAVRGHLWRQLPNMLPYVGNQATAAQRSAIWGELTKEEPKQPTVLNRVLSGAKYGSPLSAAKTLVTGVAKNLIRPDKDTARQATLAAINPVKTYADGSNAATSNFAVTASRDANSAASRIAKNNPEAVAGLAAAMAGLGVYQALPR